MDDCLSGSQIVQEVKVGCWRWTEWKTLDFTLENQSESALFLGKKNESGLKHLDMY